MYSGSSDGESHEAALRKIPLASSVLWVRNLRRFIGSGTGLGSEALMELETKRILLDIFREKQQKGAEGGSMPSFYKKKPEEESISHRVQRLVKYRFLKKQLDLLLNADDLDAMWVCLRENCVIDDATGAEKMNYGYFCHIASEMKAYVRGLIPSLAQLQDMPAGFVQMYCQIAAHKFFFFCDPHRQGKACIKKVLLSNCLQELMELHQESEEEVTDTEQAENWFSLTSAQRVCDMFIAQDKDANGTLSKHEL